jgi:hypothetical protein
MKKEELLDKITNEAVNCLKRCAIETRALHPSKCNDLAKSTKCHYSNISRLCIYEKCVLSRKTHTGERLFQNMSFWDSDTGVFSSSQSGYTHLVYLARLINCEHIAQENIDKFKGNGSDKIYNYFVGAINCFFGSLKAKDLYKMSHNIRISDFIEIENAVEKMNKMGQQIPTDLLHRLEGLENIICEMASCDKELII